MGESCRLSSGRAASTRGASGTVRRVVRERRKTTETRSARRGQLLREVKKSGDIPVLGVSPFLRIARSIAPREITVRLRCLG